jgi:hypothetical protein
VRRLLRQSSSGVAGPPHPSDDYKTHAPNGVPTFLGFSSPPEARKHWPCALQTALMCPLTAELVSQKAPESGDPPATTPRRRDRGPRHRSPRPQRAPHPGIRPPELCPPDYLNAYREVADLQDFTNRGASPEVSSSLTAASMSASIFNRRPNVTASTSPAGGFARWPILSSPRSSRDETGSSWCRMRGLFGFSPRAPTRCCGGVCDDVARDLDLGDRQVPRCGVIGRGACHVQLDLGRANRVEGDR